ncbi:MAG: nicotinamide-nucleotide amidohydrolase family protein, partial [Clostridium sp.]|nr:nicotinamide-nucleotide amidohydrolase family protein [Clostridium sp.]
LATYAKVGEVHLRITARGDSSGAAAALVEPVAAEVKRRMGDAVYTEDEAESLEMAVVRLLTEQGLTISTAESCTGGMVSARLVNVPGASRVFMEGYVTYSNEAKVKLLGVREETLAAHGAVSAQTAEEMARGGAKAAGTDMCVSITGLAGPDGGTEEKPVGLVYMACALKGQVRVVRCQFKGNRGKIREQSMMRALDLARRMILAYGRGEQLSGQEA